jgi:hypothetical protein
MQLERGHRGGRWGVTAAAALAGTLAGAIARPAQASCSGDPWGLLWTYPVNGEFYAPVDADLFISGLPGGPPSLDGELLPNLSPGVYDLGQLEPQTRYEVRWNNAAIVFTTGEEPTFPPREPASDVRVTRNPSDFARCPLVLPQGCFDTGQHTAVRFDAGPALAWWVDVVSCDGSVRQMLWPSSCGAPVVESEDRIICARLRSTQGAGFSESTGLICSVPDVPPGTLPGSSGCVGAWPPEDALTLAAGDAVTLGSLSGAATPVAPSPVAPSPVEGVTPSEPAAGCAFAAAASGRAGTGMPGIAGAGLAALILSRRRRAREA